MEMPERLCRRKVDGELFRPSHDPDNPMGGLFGGKQFYFRSVRIVRAAPKRWWMWSAPLPTVEDTGEIWEPESGEFDVLHTWNCPISEMQRFYCGRYDLLKSGDITYTLPTVSIINCDDVSRLATADTNPTV